MGPQLGAPEGRQRRDGVRLRGAQCEGHRIHPGSLNDEVVAKIDLLGPRKSGEVEFKAPTTPGDYPYLCTFPAHYQAGMKGVLTVK